MEDFGMEDFQGEEDSALFSKDSLNELDAKKHKFFNWLRRDARGPTYISYSPFDSFSASSFNFGAEGCSASCNSGGELLNLSAPSEKDGLIFVRGDFESSLYSSLARAQRLFGGPSTFGFEISIGRVPFDHESKDGAKGSSFRLGDMIDRGCFNYRWPFNEYFLCLNEEDHDITKPKIAGTCVMFSFVKEGILYQVIRVEEGCSQDSVPCLPFPPESQVVLTIGGPLWFQSFALSDRLNGRPLNPKGDVRKVSSQNCLRILDTTRAIGMEARVHQLCPDESYEQLDLFESPLDVDSGAKFGETYPWDVPAYNAFGRLPTKKERQDAIFLASIRLREAPELRDWLEKGRLEEDRPTVDWPETSWPELPGSEDIYHYVGVSPLSPRATGAMWETTFLERERKTDSPSEIAEVRLMGRSLEKILQVDVVPQVKFPERVALVSNIYHWPNIDLKAIFWKVRYLVKVYIFLSHLSERYSTISTDQQDNTLSNIPPEKDAGNQPEKDGNTTLDQKLHNIDALEMVNIAKAQLVRIHCRIKGVVRYLVHALLEPNSDTPLMPDDFVPGESNYYYVMVTLWYVVRNLPCEEWKADIRNACKNKAQAKLYDRKHLPLDNCNFGMDARDKIPLLMWYHYGSVLNLCREGFLPTEWGEVGLEWKVSRLGKVAKVSSAAKLSSNRSYAPEDEIVDRLAFLAGELGLEHLDGSLGTVTSLTMRRVKQRDYTRYINPGSLSPGEDGSTSGPWEIHALCHHSRLVIFSLEDTESENSRVVAENIEVFEGYKKKLCEFLNSEATLVPCWERDHSKALRGLLCSEATSVVASTLLDLRGKEMQPKETQPKDMKLKPKHKHKHKSSNPNQAQDDAALLTSQQLNSPAKQSPSSVRITGSKKILQEVAYIETLMDRELGFLARLAGQSGRPPPIAWATFCPPQIYHPENFTNSLEDTPHLYKPPYTNNVRIPLALREYVEDPDQKGFSIEDLKKAIKYNTGSVSVSDILAMGQSPYDDQQILTDHTGTHLAGRIKHIYQAKLPQCFISKTSERETSKHETSEPEASESETSKHETSELETAELETSERETSRHEISECEISERETAIANEGKLIQSLYDSLVDQQVQHRFLTVRKLSKHLLRLLLYVIHPESSACLSSHILCLSRFSCQRGNTWVARITLRSWIPQSVEGTGGDTSNVSSNADKDAYISLPKIDSDADEDAAISLPAILSNVEPWQTNNVTGERLKPQKPEPFKLTMSSLVLSTNAFGDFSKCTIISETVDDARLAKFVADIHNLWQKFVHQPQTGRCLVFLLALGIMCERIAEQYTKAIKAFVSLLNLDDIFLIKEETWAKWSNDHSSIPQFQLGLWSLEALYKLQNSLKESVSSVLQAKDELILQINEGPGRRSDSLQRMCQDYLGVFESGLVKLTAVNANLDRRIELSSRYKDALSAVLALRDSRASLEQNKLSIDQNELSINQNELSINQNRLSLRQNSTIERLTYLTIGYLPISLMATIFAIPKEQGVLFNEMGRGWFIGAILLMSVTTYLMALYVKRFLEFIKYPPRPPTDKGNQSLSPVPQGTPPADHGHQDPSPSPQGKPPTDYAHQDPPSSPNLWRILSKFWARHRRKETLPL